MAYIMLCVTIMRYQPTQQKHQEPIGIVIADGGTGDRAPRFSAFVWGPVPDDFENLTTSDKASDLIAAA